MSARDICFLRAPGGPGLGPRAVPSSVRAGRRVPRVPARQLGKGSGTGSCGGWLPRVACEGLTTQNSSPVQILSPRRPFGPWGEGAILVTSLLCADSNTSSFPVRGMAPTPQCPPESLVEDSSHPRGISHGHPYRPPRQRVSSDSWLLLKSHALGQFAWSFCASVCSPLPGGGPSNWPWGCPPPPPPSTHIPVAPQCPGSGTALPSPGGPLGLEGWLAEVGPRG